MLCSALSLTAKLLNWQSADWWLLEKCISGSQAMWHFRAFIRGMAGGYRMLHGPSSPSCWQATQWDTGTELGAWVRTKGTGDTANPGKAVEDVLATKLQHGLCTLGKYNHGASLHCSLVSSRQSFLLSFFKRHKLLRSSVELSGTSSKSCPLSDPQGKN